MGDIVLIHLIKVGTFDWLVLGCLDLVDLTSLVNLKGVVLSHSEDGIVIGVLLSFLILIDIVQINLHYQNLGIHNVWYHT